MLLEARMYAAPRRGGGTRRHKTNDLALLEHDSHSWCSVATESSLCFNQKKCLKECPLAGFWFLLCLVCSRQFLEDFRCRLMTWKCFAMCFIIQHIQIGPHFRGTLSRATRRYAWEICEEVRALPLRHREAMEHVQQTLFGICLNFVRPLYCFFGSGFGSRKYMVQRWHVSYVGLRRPDKKTRKVPQRLRSEVALKRLMDKELSKCLGWKTFQRGEKPVLFEASWKKSRGFPRFEILWYWNTMRLQVWWQVCQDICPKSERLNYLLRNGGVFWIDSKDSDRRRLFTQTSSWYGWNQSGASNDSCKLSRGRCRPSKSVKSWTVHLMHVRHSCNLELPYNMYSRAVDLQTLPSEKNLQKLATFEISQRFQRKIFVFPKFPALLTFPEKFVHFAGQRWRPFRRVELALRFGTEFLERSREICGSVGSHSLSRFLGEQLSVVTCEMVIFFRFLLRK